MKDRRSKKPWSINHGKAMFDYDLTEVFNRYSDFIRVLLFIMIEHLPFAGYDISLTQQERSCNKTCNLFYFTFLIRLLP